MEVLSLIQGMFWRIKNKLWEYKRLGLIWRDFTIILQLVVLFADKWTTTSAEIMH
jgi:hypothetical protein